MTKLVIYHASCLDGFGAAWAVKEHARKTRQKFDFFAAHYNRPPPDVIGRTVYMVDFSYPKEVIEEMLKEANKIVIIDHHKTAIEMLNNYYHPKLDYYLNAHKSGAGLAWEYFHDADKMPQLIKHIQDRDLWRFSLPFTKEIIEGLASYDMSFEIWDYLMERPVEELRDEGKILLRKMEKTINGTLNQTPLMLLIDGHLIPTYNLTQYISETLNRIVEKEDIPFSASYFINNEGVIFSLRSIDGKLDVSNVAKAYGGGGHRNAAGFKISYEKFKEMML